MTIDVEKLRALLAEWNQPKPKGEAGRGWEWKQRVKHGELAGEAVRALPQLLAIAEAAMAWSDWCGSDDVATVCEKLDALYVAVDAARKAGS